MYLWWIKFSCSLFSDWNSEEIKRHMCSSYTLSFTRGKKTFEPCQANLSSSIPSWQILTAHAQPFRGARDLAFCLKVPLVSLLVWVSSKSSGETARMRRLAWTFAAGIGDKYQIRLTWSILFWDSWLFVMWSIMMAERLALSPSDHWVVVPDPSCMYMYRWWKTFRTWMVGPCSESTQTPCIFWINWNELCHEKNSARFPTR